MKFIKFLFALIALIMSFSTCTDDPSTVPVPDPDETKAEPTPVGVPIGVPNSKVIGVSGGTIVSLDGMMGLEIPAGALSADTEINIQPITNFAPNGNGDAYQLSPEGIKFNKPIKITFRHDQEISETMPPLTGIAFQSTDGIWYSSEKFTWDETNKTVSAETAHFSSWARFEALQIVAVGNVKFKDKFGNRTYQLKVNESAKFELVELSLGTVEGGFLVPLIIRRNGAIIENWRANGIINGGHLGESGTITVSEGDKICTYKAPAKKPSKTVTAGVPITRNPVQLSVDLKNLNIVHPKTGKVFNNLSVNTRIQIGELKFDLEFKYHSLTALYPGVLLEDAVGIKVEVKDGIVTCSDPINSPGKISPTSKTESNGCTVTWKVDSYLGPFDVTSSTGLITAAVGVPKLIIIFTGTSHTPALSSGCPPGPILPTPASSVPLHFPSLEFNLNDDIPIHKDPGNNFTAKLIPID